MNGEPIPSTTLARVAEAAIWAPSSSNLQNVRLLLFESPKRMAALGKWKAPKAVVAKGSAGVLVMIDTDVPLRKGEEKIWSQLWWQNAAAAIQNMLLMATALGLASCWVSFTTKMSGTRLTSGKPWRELFPEYDIPLKYAVHGLVVLGSTSKVDIGGFPMGDEKHGGRPVVRQNLDKYVLQSRG